MKRMIFVASVIFLVLMITACQDCSKTDDSSVLEDRSVSPITPSEQTSDEIIGLIKNASNDISYEEVATGIRVGSGNGPFYGVDENGSAVYLMFVAEKYFGKNNWVFCHASDGTCHRVVDNSGNQRFAGITQYFDGKIFMLNFDRRVNPGSYGTTLAYYDTNTREFVQNALDINKTVGEGIDGGVSMTLGMDGQLYLSGSNRQESHHYPAYMRINPKDLSDWEYHTGFYKDLYIDRTRDIAVDATHVYEAMGDTPWILLAINKQTQTAEKLLDGKYFKLDQLQDGVGLSYTDTSGVEKQAWLYAGKLYPTDSLDSRPPWYTESTPNNHPKDNPTGYWAYSTFWDITPGIGKGKVTQLQLGRLYADADGMGEVKLGVTKDEVEQNFSIKVDTYDKPSNSLRMIDDHKLMVTGRDYSGASIINTDDDSATYLGSYQISPNVYKPFIDYADNQKKFVFSGYPSGNTAVYTLNPDDERFSKDNFDGSLGYLRKIADQNDLRPGVDIDIHRTTGMVQIGENVYFIGMQYRSGVGGALITWNTKTGEKTAFRKGVFENYQPRDMIKMGKNLIIATQAVDNREFGGEARPSTPKIMVYDTVSKKMIKEYTPLEGLNAIDSGRIQSIDGRHIIGISNNGATPENTSPNYSSKTYIYIIDTYTDEVIMQKTIDIGSYMRVESDGAAFIDGFTFIKHGDYIYTWMLARTLSTIDINGKIETYGLMPFQSKMEFANGYIYFGGSEKLKKVINPK